MSGKRLLAIFLILVFVSVGWFILAGSVAVRTENFTGRLGDDISGLWGSEQTQQVPSFSASSKMDRVGDLELVGTDLDVSFESDNRRRGLLWYATYVVDFEGEYRVSNPATHTVTGEMKFAFPDASAAYDGFVVRVDGAEVPVDYSEGAAVAKFPMNAGSVASIVTGYRANGMDKWTYQPQPGGAGVIKDFSARLRTDFRDVDYPADGSSPTSRERAGDGWELVWNYESIVTGRNIGVIMPSPTNPGPLVARITAFAPVSLLFFFAALVLLTATQNVRLHPIHYAFLAAAFFAFHLLLAYLADQVDINLAFGIGAATSVALVMGYLTAVIGRQRVLIEVAISQFVFLVLFSYSFFFEGYTGLAVTIGSILTLAFFMFKTARVDWETVFVPKTPVDAVAPPAPAPLPAQGE